MKKKIIPLILTSTLLFPTFFYNSHHTNIVYAEDNENADLIVSAEKLYLREGPGLSYAILSTLTEGQELEFIENQNDWYHVKFQGNEGWVASWLTSTKDKVEQSSTNKTIISQVNHLNLRSEPNISSPVLGQLNIGNEATIIQQKDNWLQVIFNGTTGWVSTQYVSINDNDNLIEEVPKEIENDNDNDNNEKTPSEVQVEIDPNAFTITVDAVNIRKKPDLSSKKIGIGKKGEQYEVLERNNNWVKIQFGKKKGWVYSFYGSFNVNKTETSSSTSEITDNSPTSNFVTIIYNGTNLREAPSTSSNVVVRADAGDTFNIINTDGDWFEVDLTDGRTAFVANWVVSLNDETAKMENVEKKNKKEKRKEGTLKGVTIVIDPGHGGNDKGTTGARGTEEKEINMETAELLTSKLRANGAEVILTRESDVYVDLRKRVSISHQYEADAFISIHYDATDDSSISGFTTYYINDYQQPLAQFVHEGLAEKVNLRDRGVQPGNYLVLRENKQNAILIELGYLSNPNEERIVTTDMYREQATLGIYQGILNYFDSLLE